MDIGDELEKIYLDWGNPDQKYKYYIFLLYINIIF